jgi:hypothetical protein
LTTFHNVSSLQDLFMGFGLCVRVIFRVLRVREKKKSSEFDTLTKNQR